MIYTIRKTLSIALIFTALLSACSSEDDTNDPNNNNNNNNNNTEVTVDSPVQLTGMLENSAIDYNTDQGYLYGVGWGGSVSWEDTSEFTFRSVITGMDYTETLFTMSIGTCRVPDGGYPTTEDFTSFFSTGAKEYTFGANDGVLLTLYINGVEWTTSNGSGDQTGSSFVVDDFKVDEQFGKTFVKLKATFNCVFYNGIGSSKTFTNGVFVGRFEEVQ
jgi:hypothetical protein